jgi:hypothetical protein
MDEADVEHAGVKEFIAQLWTMDPEESYYDAKVIWLTEYIIPHVDSDSSRFFTAIPFVIAAVYFARPMQ